MRFDSGARRQNITITKTELMTFLCQYWRWYKALNLHPDGMVGSNACTRMQAFEPRVMRM